MLEARQKLKDAGFSDSQADAVLEVCHKSNLTSANKVQLVADPGARVAKWAVTLICFEILFAVGASGPDSLLGELMNGSVM